jgi:choline dehydrogenase-like flavoprotein
MIEAHEPPMRSTPSSDRSSPPVMLAARMGDDPQASVVDSFRRCHDIPSLVIIDGGVMVTGGAVSPTETITALSAARWSHCKRSTTAWLVKQMNRPEEWPDAE